MIKGVLCFLLGVLVVCFGFYLNQNTSTKKTISLAKSYVNNLMAGNKKTSETGKVGIVKTQKAQTKPVQKSKIPVNRWVYHRKLKQGEDFSFDNARCLVKSYKVSKNVDNIKTLKYSAVCQGNLKLQKEVRVELVQQMLKGGG